MYANEKLNDEISLIYSCYNAFYESRCIVSSNKYVLWPEDGPLLGPKHVVNITNKHHKLVVFWLEKKLLFIC